MAFIEAFSKNADAADNMKSEEKYREIKPETGITVSSRKLPSLYFTGFFHFLNSIFTSIFLFIL